MKGLELVSVWDIIWHSCSTRKDLC